MTDMRSALVKILKRHESAHDGYDVEGNPAYSCYECDLKYPCPTRKLADEALNPKPQPAIRLEQAEARVKLLESGIVSELVVTSVNSARAIGTAVSDISEALLKLGYDGLTERLERAEQDRVKLRNRLDAMRRQRDGYRNQLRKARTNQGENK